MADVQITDEFGFNATLQLSNDSPLSKANVSHLNSVNQALKDEVDQPLDQAPFKTVSFGVDCSSPSEPMGGGVKIAAAAGAAGTLSIVKPADKTLFPNDNFTTISIAADECWIGVELDESILANVEVNVDGFGAQVADTDKLGQTTYTLVTANEGKFPTLIEGLKAGLNGFYPISSIEALRAQPIGTVCANELTGTVNFTGSYQFPMTVNALASADLPLNYKISVQPEATLKLSGSIALCGDFVVRSHKVADQTLDIGVYKKKSSTLTAAFTAAAGIGIDEGTTDLAPIILSTVLPGVNTNVDGITGDSAKDLNSALKDCIDRSLTISMNGSCSAEIADEAAIIYRVNLSSGSADKTNAALRAALQGNWTPLSQLGNAQPLRNIITGSKEYEHKIAINLFGLYNAVEENTYIQSCTILHDGNGQLSVIDKANASRIGVAAMPYAADPEKLQTALAQDFLSTVTYTVVASRVQPALTIQQSYFLYDKALPQQKMKDQVLLGSALKLIDGAPETQFWNNTLAANPVFPHARVSASAKYGSPAVLGIFFEGAAGHQPRTSKQIERAGRDAMIALIDPGDPESASRLAVLENDDIWSAMDTSGNTNAFGQIPQLSQLPFPVLNDVETAWTAVRWWADAMMLVAPKLSELLAFLDSIPAEDFNTNQEFTAKMLAFQAMLGKLARNTDASFVGGWGMAVVFALAGNGSTRSMDIGWTGATRHYESNA